MQTVDILDIIEQCFIYSLSTLQVKLIIWRVYNKKSCTQIAKLEGKSRQYVTDQLSQAYQKLETLHTS